MSFGKDMFGFMTDKLDGFTAEVYHALLGSWPARTILTLYIIWFGYSVMFKANAGEHTKEFGISALLLLALQGITMVEGGFSAWVGQPVVELAQGLGQVAVDASGMRGGDVFQSLDDGLGEIMTTIDRIEPTGNFFTSAWMYIKVGVSSFLAAIAFGIMYVVFLVLYLLAFFSLYMMLMVGGIFVWLGAFKAFRSHTWAWFRAVANYVLWVFFLSAVAGFFMSLITASVADLARWDLAVDGAYPPSLGKLIFFSVLVSYFLLKAADYSAALTGGSSMSPGIVTSGLSMMGSAAGSVGAPAGKSLMGMGGAAAGWAGSKAWGAARGGAARAFSALKGLK